MDPTGSTILLGAVILAGGRSRRMGRPKALIPLEGSTFLETIADRYGEAGIRDLLAVTFADLKKTPGFPSREDLPVLTLQEPASAPSSRNSSRKLPSMSASPSFMKAKLT